MIVYFTRTHFTGVIAGGKGLVAVFSNLRTVIWGTKAAQDALNASQVASGWGALLAVIAAVAAAIYSVVTAQTKLNEAMERVRN